MSRLPEAQIRGLGIVALLLVVFAMVRHVATSAPETLAQEAGAHDGLEKLGEVRLDRFAATRIGLGIRGEDGQSLPQQLSK